MTIPITIPALLLPMVAAVALRAATPAARTQDPAPIPTAGATEPSPAEQQFRDAWWAESGRNDTDAALRGYLGAAVADGPAAIRARALLFAGRVQQRLGDDGAALATFRRLVTQFGEQRETVEAARVHLRELTSEDLRRNYDEWFERRLFSEEVQLVILGKIEALGRLADDRPANNRDIAEHRQQVRALQGEVLAFGKGAVPALRKYATMAHEALAREAIALLFRLGEVPPLEALAAHDSWTGDPDSWAHLLRTRRPAELPERGGEHLPWLGAALRGPSDLAEMLLTRMVAPEFAEPIVGALLVEASTRKRLLEAATSEQAPLSLRIAIERALLDRIEDLPLSSEQWLAIGEDPLDFGLRQRSLAAAVRGLGPHDGQSLDTILARIGEHTGELLQSYAEHVVQPLDRHPALDLLPWSSARLSRVLQIALAAGHFPGNLLCRLRMKESTRALLADAVFRDPVPLHAAGSHDHVHDLFYCEFGDGSEALFGSRWHGAILKSLEEYWPAYTDEQRLAALHLLHGVLFTAGDRAGLSTWAQRQLAGASEAVAASLRSTIEQLGG